MKQWFKILAAAWIGMISGMLVVRGILQKDAECMVLGIMNVGMFTLYMW